MNKLVLMKIINEPFPGVKVLKPNVYNDSRGYFFESFRDDFFRHLGSSISFVQDNQSLSQKNILRGLHFQKPPHAQAKFVRVIKGSVLDVVVDVRSESPTFGHHFKVILSEENFKAMFIPAGFAHGFLTLEDHTIFSYKCTDYYYPETEGGIAWDCPELNIDWGIDQPILSDKDIQNPGLLNFNSPF